MVFGLITIICFISGVVAFISGVCLPWYIKGGPFMWTEYLKDRAYGKDLEKYLTPKAKKCKKWFSISCFIFVVCFVILLIMSMYK